MLNFDYLYNPDAAKYLSTQDHFADKKLGFRVIEHATILTYKSTITDGERFNGWGYGGIVDSNGEYVKESFIYARSGGAYTPAPESIQHSSKTVIYLGMFHSTWGHIITDNISRLWFLKSELMNQFKNCPLVYIRCEKKGAFTLEGHRDFKRFLEILEVDVDRLQAIEQPTQFDKIILPDQSFAFGGRIRKYTTEYREAIDCVRNFALKNRTPISNKKLYFYHGMRQVGEERIAQYFKSKGYDIISYENLSNLDEELNLLINCEQFASTIGSSSNKSLFLRDNSEVILLSRQASSPYSDYQLTINQFNSLNATYIDSSLSIFRPYFYFISRQLKEFFGDKFDGYEEEDFKNFLQYCRRRNPDIDQRKKDFYAPIFEDFMAQLKQREDLIAAYDMPSGWDKFRSLLRYRTRVRKINRGDGWKVENHFSNPLDQELEVFAFQIDYSDHKVYYSVYFGDKEGWLDEAVSPEMPEIAGMSNPVLGMKIRLDEAGAKEFDILYRMHKFDGTWTPWAKNGEELYSDGIKVNAIQITLEPIKIQPDKVDAKKLDDIQPDKANLKVFDYTQMFLSENDKTIYLQVQAQDLTQIK